MDQVSSDMNTSSSTVPQKAVPTIKLGHMLAIVVFLGGYVWLTLPAQPLTGWGHSFQTAQQQAIDLHKPMLLAFYMEGCGPCLAMDRNVLPRKEVSNAMKNYIPVRLDATHERELANRYGVYGTPTYAVVQPDGQLVDKCDGYHSTEEFVAFIERANSRMATAAQDLLDDPSTTVP